MRGVHGGPDSEGKFGRMLRQTKEATTLAQPRVATAYAGLNRLWRRLEKPFRTGCAGRLFMALRSLAATCVSGLRQRGVLRVLVCNPQFPRPRSLQRPTGASLWALSYDTRLAGSIWSAPDGALSAPCGRDLVRGLRALVVNDLI
jgi:hypothetical protein